MPKVRASSGTIGTQRSPTPGNFINAVSMRTNAMVVDSGRSEPSSMAAKVSSGGTSIASVDFTRR
jgi:hypothetical protein